MINLALIYAMTFAASATPARTDAEILAHARPLIESYLEENGREYGVDLRPDPTTYVVRRPFMNLLMEAFLASSPYAFVRPAEPENITCRDVTVDLPARGARAHFYVARAESRTQDAPARYKLVGPCSLPQDGRATMNLDLLPLGGRRFAKREFAARAQPLVQNYLTLAGETAPPDWSSARVRRARGWFADLVASPLDDCRAVEVRVGGTRRRVYVSARGDVAHFLADLPLALQSLFKDAASLRTYRFAVVRGCDGHDQERAPEGVTPSDHGA